MFAIGAFTKYTEQKQIKEISYYVEPAYEKYASMIFHKTPEMIAFFSSITGVPYPWEKYSQIVVRDYVSGAMENTSASLFGAFMLQDSIAYEDQNYEDVVSHELFHQWFGDYVTAESWSHLTLNESFATYGEYLWRKHQYGINNADELAYDDLQKYLGYAQYNDPTLVRHHYKDKEDMFDRISYQKGGAVLHYMHYLLGDSVFYKAMYFYLNENKFQNAETHQWRLAVEKASGQDWNPFFNEWYYKAGHPKLNIEHIVNIDSGIVQVNIKQVQDSTIGLYHLPIDAWLIYGNEKSLVHWDISKKEQHYTYPIRNGIKPLIIPDAYHVLPAEIYEHKSLSAWKEQMLLKPDFYTQKIVLQHLKKEDAQREEFKEIIRLGLQSPIASIRTNSLELIAKFVNPEHYDTWKAQIIHLTEQESNHKTKATAIAVLGKSKFERKTEMLLQALNEKSYFVQAASVEALYENQYPQKDSLVRALLWHKANTALDQSLWQIISEAAQANDTILFKQLIIPQTDEENRNHWERNTLNYCSKVNNIESFDVLLNTIKQRWKILNDPIVTTDQKVQFYKRFIQTLTTKKDLNQESPLNKQKIQHLQNAIAQLYNPMH